MNVTIPLGSFDWQKNAPDTSNGSAAPSMPRRPHSPCWRRSGRPWGNTPPRCRLAYKATDKEGTTFATVGAGNINVSDTAKQAALEKDGKTGALGKLNRDVTKTQVITKNTTEAFNLFVSTDSIKTVAAIVQKAAGYIDALVSTGKLSPQDAEQAKKVLNVLLSVEDIANFSICGGSSGSQQGFLHILQGLIISPAQAAVKDGGCALMFRGEAALSNLSSEAYTADRELISKAALDVIAADRDAYNKELAGDTPDQTKLELVAQRDAWASDDLRALQFAARSAEGQRDFRRRQRSWR